ncbi:hypothetical protein [Caenispirillum salinarum]|uniref:hypothetical protein n=1 Tax=Caenispirillum salinarum TaxID=859058 RepID=UPI00384AE415
MSNERQPNSSGNDNAPPEKNVVRVDRWQRPKVNDDLRPLQLELFLPPEQAKGLMLFYDVDGGNEVDLLRVISQHAVKYVLDLRMTRRFPEKRYDHKGVSDYLAAKDIAYNFAKWWLDTIDSPRVVSSEEKREAASDLEGRINSHLSGGCLLVMHGSLDHRLIMRIRRVIGRLENFRGEIHPHRT